MHGYAFKGRGRHGHRGGGWGAMRGARHGWHGGWGPPGRGRRRRMRRGDVRAAVLVLLDEGPMTGYGLMGEIERRSDGAWRPSPGSVYPTLALLEDEGLIRPQSGEGFGEDRLELRSLIGQVAAATYQVAMAGDDAHIEKAKEILTEARRSLYRILADEDPATEE
jgi:hypothetical protein